MDDVRNPDVHRITINITVGGMCDLIGSLQKICKAYTTLAVFTK